MSKVLFAPDWHEEVPYQRFLADALRECGVEVEYLTVSKRLFPLSRGTEYYHSDLLHLHWPDAYYPQKRDSLDVLRRMRFSLDLSQTNKKLPFVITAHNLYAHNRINETFVPFNTEFALKKAGAVFAHSEKAKEKLLELFGLNAQKIHVIPHGDISPALGVPGNAAEARQRLGIDLEKLCLMFGAVEPYKGIEEIIEFWRTQRPGATLAIVGKPVTEEYHEKVAQLVNGAPHIITNFNRVSDAHLKLWLDAANCVIFNYREIFTSGAACLTRSWGVPILLPTRSETVDLDEPHPSVFRFENLNKDFFNLLHDALQTPPSYEAAAEWREKCAWRNIAKQTAAVYDTVLKSAPANE